MISQIVHAKVIISQMKQICAIVFYLDYFFIILLKYVLTILRNVINAIVKVLTSIMFWKIYVKVH